MAITDKNTLKSWFLRGLKPLASQFADWMDSYWHKSEKIPVAAIDTLEDVLNEKAEQADITDIRQSVTNVTNNFNTLTSNLHKVATTGNYEDLNNLPDLALDDYVIAQNFKKGILIETDIAVSELTDLNVIRLEFSGNTVNDIHLVGMINVNYVSGEVYTATGVITAMHYNPVVFLLAGKIHFWLSTNRPADDRIIPKMYMRLKCTTDAENFNRIVNISDSEHQNWPIYMIIDILRFLVNNDSIDAETLSTRPLLELSPSIMYNATMGLLVKTNIAATAETPFLLHVTANTNTDSAPPLDMYVQGTNNPAADAIIFASGTTNQAIMSIKAFVYENRIHFWMPTVGGKQLQAITCYTNGNINLQEFRRSHSNVITSVTDAVLPTAGVTRLVTITPKLPTPPTAPIEDSGWLSTPGTPTSSNVNIMEWDSEFACKYRIIGKQCYFKFMMHPGASTGECFMSIKVPATLFNRISPIYYDTSFYHYSDNSVTVEIGSRAPGSNELYLLVTVSTLRVEDALVISFSHPLN